MALITCKECKKEISSNASTCPHCGCNRTTASRFWLFFFVVLAVIFILWMLRVRISN